MMILTPVVKWEVATLGKQHKTSVYQLWNISSVVVRSYQRCGPCLRVQFLMVLRGTITQTFLNIAHDYGICGSPPTSVCNISFDFRIKTNAVPRCVDPVIPNVDLETFQRPFGAERGLVSASQFISQEAVSPLSSPGDSPRPSSPAMPAKV